MSQYWNREAWGLCDPWHSDPYGEFEPLRVGPKLTVDGTIFEMGLVL